MDRWQYFLQSSATKTTRSLSEPSFMPTVYQKQHNLALILSGAVLAWMDDGRSKRWQVLRLSQVWPDPNTGVFGSWGKLRGWIPRGRGELKVPVPRKPRGSFDMQGFVSAVGSAETKVKLPSGNNWRPFYSVFHMSPPVAPQLSSESNRGREELIVKSFFVYVVNEFVISW